MIISEKHKDIVRWVVEYALKKGCSAVRVSVIVSIDNTFEYRDRQLDKLQQSSENKLFIELFVDGCYGSLSTNRIEKTELETFISKGIASTRFLAPDLFRTLPDPSRYFKGEPRNLDLCDKTYNSITAEDRVQLAKNIVDEVYGSDDRIISVSSYVNDTYGAEYMLVSDGFVSETEDTAFSIGAEVSLKTSTDARSESYWSESNIFWNELPTTGISSKAFERALGKIGQRKIKSGKYSMLLDNRISSRLLSPMISAMFGSSLQQKNSFLLDRLNQKITSKIFTLTDTPHIERNFGSRWFDGEGVATTERPIIEEGVLRTYFIDTYHSKKMNIDPTVSSPSILSVTPGELDFEGMLKAMFRGIWVTGFNGGNCNPTTGDFSFGIEGFLVEQGKIVQPVGEMNITGNMLSLWESLYVIGGDIRPNSSWKIPSLLFMDVNFSGI